MKILVIAGKKQAGKTTTGNFVAGYTMTQLSRAGHAYLPTKFIIDEETGDLIVDTIYVDAEDNPVEASRVLDLYDQDPEFLRWAEDRMWPHIKLYAYADLLKAVLIQVFGVSYESLNGTNEEKNAPTHIKWKNMCSLLPARVVSKLKRSEKYEKNMSGRELMQYFGTEVCRRIMSDCWVQSCFTRILMDQPELAVITDARMENEVKIPKTYRSDDVDVKIVKLERAPHYDIHESETGLDKLHNNNYDLVIPPDVTVKKQNQLLLEAMYDWGWFEEHISLEAVQ
jgi:hypothetical protein